MRITHVVAMAAGLVLLANAPVRAQEDEIGKDVAESVGKQAKVANDLALLDRQAIAMAEVALDRTDSAAVRNYAQRVKEQHQQHLSALESWADDKKVEIASVAILVPGRGMGGAGLTEDQKKQLDERLSKYEEDFAKKAREAQDEVVELAQTDSEDLNDEFLSDIADLQNKGAEQARDAQKDFKADTTFAGLMAVTATTYSDLASSAKNIEDQLKD